MKKSLPLFLIAMFIFAIHFQANSQTYELQRWAIGSGGSVALENPSTGDSLYGLVGQTAIFSITGDPGMLHQGFWVPYSTVGVEDNPISLSEQLVNYPNPFSNFTTVKYTLPGNGLVTIRIFDNVGRLLKTLVSEVQASGQHEIAWDGKDEEGYDCASGSYMYELSARPSQSAGYGSFKDISLRNVMVIVR